MGPTLKIRVHTKPLKLSNAASRSFMRLDSYDWILFSSKHAVDYFVRQLKRRRVPVPKVPVGAVGPETAKTVRANRMKVGAMPKKANVLSLVRELGSVHGKRILFPRSVIASNDAVRTLRAKGARVTVVPLYTTFLAELPKATKRRALAGGYGTLSFTSPSGVRGFLSQFSSSEKQKLLAVPAECIGETTAAAARKAGFKKVFIR